MMPAAKENVLASVERWPTTLLDARIPTDDGNVIVDPKLAIPAFYHDCDAGDAQAAVDRLRPMRFDAPPKLARAAWQDIPSTYVVCTDDQALHPELQREHSLAVIERVQVERRQALQPATKIG